MTIKPALFAVFLLISSLGQVVSANEYLGVLRELNNPESEIGKQLGLTDEQRLQIKQLNTKRLSSAIGLAAQLKEAPKSEQAKMVAEFVAESEKLAFDVLNPEQRTKLTKLRIQWLGLTSLVEEDIAAALNLADWQKQVVQEWREQLRAARRVNNDEKVKPQADRAIRRELSDSQYAVWQFLAGIVTERPAGQPTPPERKGQPSGDRSSSGSSSGAPLSPEEIAKTPIEKVELELNFKGQPWGTVIKWLADQADMSVQTEVYPPGSFTYHDRSRKYSISETLDLMNADLLDSGYTLYRSGRSLRCINFEENQEKAGELFKELADRVSEEDIFNEKYGRYEPIKVLFTLKRLNPDDIKAEVEGLLSLQGTVKTLATSGQLLVTDLAGNVRNVAEFIKSAEDPQSARGAGVQSFQLKHINAEEILAVARPLLELQDGANTSPTVKISTNAFGTVIYAKGDADKIQIIKDLVEQMDKPIEQSNKSVAYETPYVGRHSVQGLEIQLAYEVITQLLAGTPDVRLAKDEASKQLILMGRKADHELTKTTLDSLAGAKSDFQVIQLERLDPQMAIAAVKKFFGLADKASSDSGQPVIDGDLMARQVWVKGSEEQVNRIKNLIQELERNAKATKNIWGDKIRMLPAGSGSADAIRQAEVLWQQMYGKSNPIVRDSNDYSVGGALKFKTLAPEKKPSEEDESGTSDDPKEAAGSKEKRATSKVLPKGDSSGREVKKDSKNREKLVSWAQEPEFPATVAATNATEGVPIIIRNGPGGLMISSDDTEALERFENLLRMIMDQSNAGGDQPEVIYLQNIKAAAAKELLTDVLSGAASSGGAGGGLLGDMATGVLGGLGGGMLGTLLGGSGGGGSSSTSSVGLAKGDYSIVADPRLNALFISASPPDRMLIEQVIKVIDQPESPFPIETRGTTALIPVTTQDVSQVLSTVKSVFGDRIEGNSNRGGGGAGGQPNPAEIFQAMRTAMGGGGRGRGGSNSELTEPKISISADTFTNTLVVVAQPQQIDEIRRLVSMIDEAGEGEKDDVVVINLGNISSTGLTDSLKRILGSKVTANTSGTTPAAGGNAGGAQPVGGQNATDAARQRAEFFQNMMQRGGGFGNAGAGQGGRGQGGGAQGGGGRGNFGGGNFGGGNFGGGNRGGGR